MKSQKKIVLAALLAATFSTRYIQTAIFESTKPIEGNKNGPAESKPYDQRNIMPTKAAIIDAYHQDSTKAPADLLPSSRANNNNSTIVTPAALLKTVLSNSNENYSSRKENYQEKFNELENLKYDKSWNIRSPEDLQLIQQAKTLLVRAHPEVLGNNFVATISYLPNRFMSYFKEKMPTFSQEAGRQRFTQSVIMEALKSMPEIDRFQFSKSMNDKIDAVTKKYTDSLSTATNTEMFLQWCRNLLVDLALLAPRTAAAAVGGTVGLTGNVVTRTIPATIRSIGTGIGSGVTTGATVGNIISSGYTDTGLFSDNYYNSYAKDQSIPEYTARTAVAIPAALATGITTGAVTTAKNLAENTIFIPTAGATRGAQYGTKLVDQAANAFGNAATSTGDYFGSFFKDQSTNNSNS